MDGLKRFILRAWIPVCVFALAGGCRTTKQQMPDATLPQSGEHKSMFGMGTSGFKPQTPKGEQVVVKSSRGKAKGMKPETEIVFADTDVEAALMEGRSTTERDMLLDKARQGYQKALKTEPKNKEALLGLARLYTHSGDRARATEQYAILQKAYPKDHELSFHKARMLARFEDWNGAVDSCSVALAADPENLKYPKAIAYYKAQAGQWNDAFTLLLKKMPEADARFFLGRVLLDLNRMEEGKEQMTLALKANPQHEEAQWVMAEINAPSKLEAPEKLGNEPVYQAGFQGSMRK